MRLWASFLVLALVSLACGQYVGTPTPTPPPSPSPQVVIPSPSPAPTVRPSATAEADVQTTTVKRVSVNVHKEASVTSEVTSYVYGGDIVTVIEIDGDWVHIQEPDGWVYIGCLDGLSEKKCEEAK